MRTLNERFIMVPISLLDVPEFVRHFDSKAIGSIHRVLSSKVWRVPTEQLRKNSSKRIKKLTELYENGYLVSLLNLEELSDAVGYEQRSVRRELNMLEYLNLIKIYKENNEVYYVVGEVGLSGKSGANMGLLSEGFYLDHWRDFVNLASEFSPLVYEKFREDVKNLFKDGQICHDFLPNLSQIRSMDDLRKLEQDLILKDAESSLIDKVIDINNSAEPEVQDSASVFMAEIRAEKNPLKAITLSRKFLREEQLTLSQVKLALSSHVDLAYSQFSVNPMFAIRLKEYSGNTESKDNEAVKLANLWVSLREDVTGVPFGSSSKEFSKIIGIAKNLLRKYSFTQVLWTLKKVVSENVSDTEFLASSGVTTLEFFVKKHAKEYQAIRDHRLHISSSRDTMLENDSDEVGADDLVANENSGRMFSLLRQKEGFDG